MESCHTNRSIIKEEESIGSYSYLSSDVEKHQEQEHHHHDYEEDIVAPYSV